jgi:hypothetical protein
MPARTIQNPFAIRRAFLQYIKKYGKLAPGVLSAPAIISKV